VVLVTGSAGLLGANLVMVLRNRDRRVAGLYRGARFAPPQVETTRVDLSDFEALASVAARLEPSWIVHCAAATNVDWCETHQDEAFRDNVTATSNVARIARIYGANMVYISTDAVYGDGPNAHTETEEPRPHNVYARTKLEGEEVALKELEGVLVLRTTLYGWNAQNKTSLAEWVLRQLSAGKTIPGFVDVIFNPLLANDLAEVIVTLIDRGCSGIYNVAGSESCSKYEFAARLARVFGLDPGRVQQASIKNANMAAVRACNSTLDTSKVSAETGSPTPAIEAGLLRFKVLDDSGFVTELKSYLKEVA
jgi:dTDP-4-dehydrorhamnose reductase